MCLFLFFKGQKYFKKNPNAQSLFALQHFFSQQVNYEDVGQLPFGWVPLFMQRIGKERLGNLSFSNAFWGSAQFGMVVENVKSIQCTPSMSRFFPRSHLAWSQPGLYTSRVPSILAVAEVAQFTLARHGPCGQLTWKTVTLPVVALDPAPHQ